MVSYPSPELQGDKLIKSRLDVTTVREQLIVVCAPADKTGRTTIFSPEGKYPLSLNPYVNAD
jgi:hypothetical protein